jgi:N-methylhydantoinase A
MRYTGQGYELQVPVDAPRRRGLTAASLGAARRRFDDIHARIHGHAAEERPVEIVSYRLRARVPAPKYVPAAAPSGRLRPAPAAARKGTRAVQFDAGRRHRTAIFERALLPPGARIDGPAIVEQLDATAVIPPGWRGAVDRLGNLVLTRSRS